MESSIINRLKYALTLSVGLLLAACSQATPQELLQRAQQYQSENEMSSAIIELKNALQQDPNFGAARLMLGELYLTSGDPASALKELERALDAGIEKSVVLEPLLTAKNQLGRYQEVLGELEQTTPLTPELLVVQGRAYLAAEDPTKAEAAFNSALAVAPELSGATLGLASLAWLRGDLVAAGQFFEKATQQNPDNREVWLQKGEFELSRQEPKSARASFEKALALPGPDVIPQMGIARAQLIEGETEPAEQTIDAVLKRAPDYPMANYLKALVRYQNDDVEGTEAALRTVLKTVPNHYPSVYLMGVVKYRQQQYAQAENNIARFLARFPENLSARKLLATLQLQEKRPEAALETLAPYATSISDAQGLALLGTTYMQNGQLAEATEALQKAADLDPDMSEIRTQLALSLLASGDSSAAVTELESAVKLNSDIIRNDILLVLIALREGKLDDALARAQDFQQRNPDNTIALNLLGAAQLAKADTLAAISSFEKALQIDPGFRPAVTNLARLRESEGDLDGARKLYSDFLETNTTDAGAMVARARVELKAGDIDAAVKDLEQASATDDKALEPRLILSRMALAQARLDDASAAMNQALNIAPDNPSVQLLRGQVEVARGNIGQAREALDAVQRYVDSLESKNVELLMQLAVLQMQTNDLKNARQNLQKVVAQSDAKNTNALIALTRLELRAGDADAAGRSVKALEALIPDNSGLEIFKGDLAQLNGQVAEAEKHYQAGADAGNREATLKLAALNDRTGDHATSVALMQSWLKKNPEDTGMQLALGSAYLSSGANAEAIEIYERLQQSAPDNPIVLNNLAWLYLERGDSRAEALARKAHELAPDSADIADTLGWILLKNNGVEESLGLFQQAAAKNGENGSIQYHLGLAYSKLGRTSDATAALQSALEKGDFPERGEAEALLETIEG